MNWLEISASVDVEGVEAVGALFREYVHGGVVIEEDITLLSDREGYRVNADKPVIVKGYLTVHHDTQATVRHIEESLWHLGRLRPIGPLQTREVAEEDWEESWKRFFHVHRVGRRTVVKPSWQECQPAPHEVVIDIDPGMAFGTGLHPTTQLCLMELEDRLVAGSSVLDLGTGSGILSIAAAKLGAGRVLAVDVDPVAVEVASKNVNLNGVGDRVAVQHGSLPLNARGAGQDAEGAVFDLVLANIIASVIIDLSGEISRALRSKGVLVASGILDERAEAVAERIQEVGLELTAKRTGGEWVALIARKSVPRGGTA